MPLTRLIIKNFKSIKNCDISLSELNVLIGENGTGKTNLLDAISYFYRNLTDSDISEHVFDENNHYSNELRITLVYDLSQFVKISKSNSGELPDIFEDQFVEKTKYGGYYKTIISMASKSKDKKLCVELSQIKGRPIRWNYSYEDRLIFKSLFPIFYIDTRSQNDLCGISGLGDYQFSFELREPRRDGQGDTNSGRGFGRRRCVLPPHEEQKSAGHSPLQPHDCHSAGVWAIPWRGVYGLSLLHRNGYTTDGERLAAIYRKVQHAAQLLPICNIIVNQHPSDNREKGLLFPTTVGIILHCFSGSSRRIFVM